MTTRRIIPFVLVALALVAVRPAFAQRPSVGADEIAARRLTLMSKVPDGLIILFADVSAAPGVRFVQDNDFYYFTGLERRGRDPRDGAAWQAQPTCFCSRRRRARR